MMPPLDVSQVVRSTVQGASGEEGLVRVEARNQFEKLRGRGIRQQVWAALRRKSRRMCVLGSMSAGQYEGVKRVALDDIWGSENRSDEFDSDFQPIAEHLEDRWVSVWTATYLGKPLPPVELLAHDGGYYIRDGHHRVSVARALGYETIEAIVTHIMDSASNEYDRCPA